MTSDLTQVGFLLFVSALVAMLSRRLHLPYTVGLVLAGMALYFSHIYLKWHLSKDLIFTVFLPPLVFEAALFINWKKFKKDLPVIALLVAVTGGNSLGHVRPRGGHLSDLCGLLKNAVKSRLHVSAHSFLGRIARGVGVGSGIGIARTDAKPGRGYHRNLRSCSLFRICARTDHDTAIEETRTNA